MDNGNKPINVIKDLTSINQMGLTKREYFAGLAMQGFCADKSVNGFENIAKYSVEVADILLKELDK